METFVVRIWRATDPGDGGSPGTTPSSLRGFVEHIGSGRSMPFQSGQELLDLFTGRLAGQGPGQREPGGFEPTASSGRPRKMDT